MEAYQERVVAEKKDLDEKRERLASFIAGASFQSLDEAEQNRLVRQNEAMRFYSSILGERIAAFK